MSKYDPNDFELDDILRQVDSVINDEPQDQDEWYDEEDIPDDEEEFDLNDYAPSDAQDDSQIFYQNYSNGYGSQVRNYRNNYGGQEPPPEPVYEQPSIPAYNADFHQARPRNTKSQAYKAQQRKAPAPRRQECRDYDEPDYPTIDQCPARRPKAPKSRKRRGGCGCGCGTVLVALVAAMVGLYFWLFQAPKSDVSIGDRKSDTATILICGTDADGTRTDTMMLLYLSGSEKKVGLMSLPRDTYTITSAGNPAKLNSAYGRNGTGEEGMEGLLDYVQDIIGYRPDGYILMDFTLVPQVVDTMGGVEIEVPQDMDVEGTSISAGFQQLNGEQVLAMLRFRSGYATADLGRIQVQRQVLKACLDQWLTLDHVGEAGTVLNLVENGSLSSLNTRNYLWIAKTLLFNISSGFTTETLPGYADYIGGASYYILNAGDVADLINESFNPYEVTITTSDLNIAG